MTADEDIILKDFTANLSRASASGAEYIPTSETTAALGIRYPFFILPLLLRLRDSGLSAEERRAMSLKAALLSSDRSMLFRLTDSLGKEFADFYPTEEEETEMTTDQAIDTFLSTYGTPDKNENEIIEKLIFNPVPEYSQVLMRESEPNETENEGEKAEATPNPDSMLSESLAKIYIKQRRYEKAYEIIANLNLNFPEKSRYFADQLRFLRKLIYINENK